MSAEMAQKLVQGGIKAVRSGDNDLARKAFTQALKLDPNNEAAWLGMATITEGATDKLRILNKVLEINPDNERAQEAVRRLSPDDSPSDDAPVEEPALADEEEEEIAGVESARVSGEIAPITGIKGGDTGELSDFPIPDWSQDEDIPEDETRTDIFAEPEPKRISQVVIRRSEDVFAKLAPPPTKGRGGIPIVDSETIEETSQQVDASIQAFLEDALADYLTPDVTWERKERGRAGSGEYRNLILEIAVASLVTIFIIGGALAAFVATNATAQRYLFGPSDTPMPTATFTPTATPGVTNTPSPTPLVPASETPSLSASVTPGNPDPNFPPDATTVYYPVPVDAIVNQALVLMQEGDLEPSRELLDVSVSNVELTGEFPPFYRLAQWYLLNDEPDEARDLLTDWQEEWEVRDTGLFDNSESLLLIALARVDIYEARNGLGERFSLLNTAQNRLEASLGLAEGDERIIAPDAVNDEGYILLAESYALQGEVDEALDVIDQGLGAAFDDRNLYGNTELRMAKARILAEADRIPEALQELYFILELNPFLESALIYQTELALESGQAGLGVLYAQQYLLYYPGSLQGFYLLGQAREAERKFDLALNAYSRALAGDTTDENYTSDPFFLEVLLARADLFVRQGQRQLAANDFTLALELTDNNPTIRVRRLESSYSAGNYEDVLVDVEELLGEGELAQSQVLYYQGLALIDLARLDEDDALDDNYDLAIEALDRAVALGLPSALRPNAQEYLAIANLEQRIYGDALDAINNALETNVTAQRLYLRGLILEGQGSLSDALLDYEFIVTWGQYYDFPFFADAQERYEDIIRRLGRR